MSRHHVVGPGAAGRGNQVVGPVAGGDGAGAA